MRPFLLIATCVTVLGMIPSASRAESFMFSSGNLAAQADFNVVSGNLQVQLTNTSTYDVLVPSDVLTALFFSIPGDPSLSRNSAVVANGSTVVYDPDGQPAGGIVGGEWSYKNGLGGELPHGATQGISSTGFDDVFGPGDRFPGSDLQKPTSPDGLQYGILSDGDDTSTGNSGILDSGGMIKNSVVFTLGNLPAGFTLSQISNVSFQYGTSQSQPNFPGTPFDNPPPPVPPTAVPEPSSLALLGCGFLNIGYVWLRRKRRRPGKAVSR